MTVADIIMAMDIIYSTIVRIEKIADKTEGDVREELNRIAEMLWEVHQILEHQLLEEV
jgi:hypothetical protein